MILSHHLATTLLYNVSHRWSLNLNGCVAALASEALKAPVSNVPFLLEPILVDLEGGALCCPHPPHAAPDLVSGGGGGSRSARQNGSKRSVSGGSGSGSGNTAEKRGGKYLWGEARVRVKYDAHLPVLSLRYRENSQTIVSGNLLPTLHSHVLSKKWHMCRVCGDYRERKNSHVPTPPEVATDISGMLKTAQGN